MSPNVYAQGRWAPKDNYHDPTFTQWLRKTPAHATNMINQGTFLEEDGEAEYLFGNLYKAFPGSCVGEWENYPVLLPGYGYEMFWNGASYWVPPALGGCKDLGHRAMDFFNPDSTLWPKDWWVTRTLLSLTFVDTSPTDNAITMSEFLNYLKQSPSINQQWLSHEIIHAPCTIVNAQIHYNHSLHYFALGLSLVRRGCPEISQDGYSCLSKKWKLYKTLHRGVPYIQVKGERFDFSDRPKTEIDAVKGTQEMCRRTIEKAIVQQYYNH